MVSVLWMANTLAFQLYSLRDYEGGWATAFEAVKAALDDARRDVEFTRKIIR